MSKVDVCVASAQICFLTSVAQFRRTITNVAVCARRSDSSAVVDRSLNHGRKSSRGLFEAFLREMHVSNPAIVHIVATFQQLIFHKDPDPAKCGGCRHAGTDAELRDSQAFCRVRLPIEVQQDIPTGFLKARFRQEFLSGPASAIFSLGKQTEAVDGHWIRLMAPYYLCFRGLRIR